MDAVAAPHHSTRRSPRKARTQLILANSVLGCLQMLMAVETRWISAMAALLVAMDVHGLMM
jgi:hypothetical protein